MKFKTNKILPFALPPALLALAFSNWTTLGTASEVSPGHFQFTDPQATNGPQRPFLDRSP
jgi:hypothetical protein